MDVLGGDFSRVSCKRGTRNSKISSMVERENETVPKAVEKCRMMLKRDCGRSDHEPGGGVVCSQRAGVRVHIMGVYNSSSRNFPKESRLYIIMKSVKKRTSKGDIQCSVGHRGFFRCSRTDRAGFPYFYGGILSFRACNLIVDANDNANATMY